MRIDPPLALVLALAAPAAAGDFQDYLHRPDASYASRLVSDERVPGGHAYAVQLTSQTWRGIEWRHWLSVVVPEQVRHPDAAVLIIDGGSNHAGPPRTDSPAALMLAAAAQAVGAPVVTLGQVPNQPLFDGLSEDGLIAHTFDRFLHTGEPDWPLLLPMVKSAVRAMDAAQDLGRQRLGLDLQRFIVTGVSKRGWTAWLTAAHDPRVAGVAPTVIDLLNLEPQLQLQLGAYGRLSAALGDYVARDIPRRFDTPRGRDLLALVDPFHHRQALGLPKLILLGTNDAFWTLDAANLYFPHLPGPKALRYQPNGGHGLSRESLPTLLAFIDRTLRSQPMPDLQWGVEHGRLRITAGEPGAATLWQATADTRDFRDARWRATDLGRADRFDVALDPPARGYRASYVDVRFEGEPPFSLSTRMVVLPERLPFAR